MLRSLLRFAGLSLFFTYGLLAFVPIAITSSPSGRAFSVTGTDCNGGEYSTPQTLIWTPGTSCTITFISPQGTEGGIRYVFDSWQDGVLANPRVVIAPAQPTTYSANFLIQYFLTALANPPEGGAVLGGGWYTAGTIAVLNAVAASGYRLVDWTPPGIGQPGTNSASVNMSFPQTAKANFEPALGGPPNTYVLSQVAIGSSAFGNSINSFGQVVVYSFPSGTDAGFWTPFTANGTAGSLTILGGLPNAAESSNLALGINDRGQVVGITTPRNGMGQAFLWSPDMANGTLGSMTAFLENFANGISSLAFGINSFGQIAGQTAAVPSPSAFLWTPSTANGSTGTVNTDSRLAGLKAINNFGQAIMNGPQTPTLFTPSAPNGGSGSFTPVSGLPGATNQQLVAINSAGTILGLSCLGTSPQFGCIGHAFLWTPTSPNGTTGVAREIPLPTGIVSMFPVGLNDSGQVVGTMLQASGVRLPFLYTAGAVFDLNALGAQLQGATPVGINKRGQIVVNTNTGAIYLLTPNQPRSSLSQLAVFRPPVPVGLELGFFTLDSNGNNEFDAADKTWQFGLAGDIPIAGDWTGSGVVRLGVVRCPAPGTGLCTWYLDENNNGKWDGTAGGDVVFQFGLPGDFPVVGDWNGSGVSKAGVMRCPVVGVCTWFLDVGNKRLPSDPSNRIVSYGVTGDKPAVGNWSNTVASIDQVGVFRCSATGGGVCIWIVDSDGNGVWSAFDNIFAFGLPGDTPVVGNWNGDGAKRIGIFREGQWFVDTNGNGIFDAADQVLSFGQSGDKPVVGLWTVQ